MNKRRKLKLNMRFSQGRVICAKSPVECKTCGNINQCEEMEMYYYPYDYKDIKECFKNSERRK